MTTPAKIKTIVAGIDFSDYATTVVHQARVLADLLDAEIVYTFVFEDPVVAPWKFEEMMGRIRPIYEDNLRERYAIDDNEVVNVRCGVAFEELIKAAKEVESPLIVVGHRGSTGNLARFFLGSTAERLSIQSPFPVWIHRGPSSYLPKNMLVPCDLSDRAVHTMTVTDQIGLHPGEAEYFHVLQPPAPILDTETWYLLAQEIEKANKEEILAFEKKHGSVHVAESVSRDVPDEIKKRSEGFDLVAISPRRHEGFFPSFGSVTAKVVKNSEVSVLVVP